MIILSLLVLSVLILNSSPHLIYEYKQSSSTADNAILSPCANCEAILRVPNHIRKKCYKRYVKHGILICLHIYSNWHIVDVLSHISITLLCNRALEQNSTLLLTSLPFINML